MITLRNFIGQNKNINVVEQKGIFTIIEHNKDLSVSATGAQTAYFMKEMAVKQRQVIVRLENNAIRLNPGAMQMMSGNIAQTTNIQGAGDLLGKAIKSKMTGDSVVKPVYSGTGILITEPTYNHLLVENVEEWGGMVCDDGMFVCCDDEIKDKAVMRSNFSSAIAGGEGLFNLCLEGKGYAVIQSPCPREELYEVILENDCFKIDGNNAICWSDDLQFTVERSGKSIMGSAASGEGYVNVYRGTGKILVAPLR